jgi:hypothetical protein
MDIRDYFIAACSALVLAPVLLLSITVSSAQMQSTNYKIQSDSINFGGGLSTSTNYTLESTAGEAATGDSSSASYNVRAGYQQMVTNFISMTSPGTVAMTPSLSGITGGTSNGSTTVTVTTDGPAGYELSIRALESPAMKKGSDSIADYVPAGDPDFDFTVGSSDAYFGYSPSGIDIVQRFKDDGADCNTGTDETALACWDGLNTGGEAIARGSAANTPSGATTTVYFRVGLGNSVVQAEGTYTATTTLTAISL